MFLYQYNRDNKREKRAGRKKKDNTDKGSDPAKEKRAARRHCKAGRLTGNPEVTNNGTPNHYQQM